jgi:hypothetical protein
LASALGVCQGYIYKELPNGAKLTEEFIEILEKSELKRLTAKYK